MYAVILFNLGGPDSLESIQPFLVNLFKDRDIFKIPINQNIFAKFLAGCRAPKVRKKYAQIGGKSPINKWTELQRSALQIELKKEYHDIEVFTAMRYWHPAIKDVARKIAKQEIEKIVLLPLYPHYSITTTGSAFNEWKRCYHGDPDKLSYVHDYFDNQKYIVAINERIDEALLCFPEDVRDDIQLLFSAHGTPKRLSDKGDPYSRQIEKTIKAVMAARNFSHDFHLCFQSKVGPVKWLQPYTDMMITTLASQHKKQLLVIPISFVSDHIETLYELDREYRAVAEREKIENYMVTKGLNDSEIFISALKELVMKALNE